MILKEQALYNFWSKFSIPAYDELTTPNNAQTPYITYQTVTDSFGSVVSMTASIWYRGTSWLPITQKKKEIEEYLGLGGIFEPYDEGALYITKGSPFAQRMEDTSDDSIRRIVLNIQCEFLSI